MTIEGIDVAKQALKKARPKDREVAQAPQANGQLQNDLDEWINRYNNERTQGDKLARACHGNGTTWKRLVI